MLMLTSKETNVFGKFNLEVPLSHLYLADGIIWTRLLKLRVLTLCS